MDEAKLLELAIELMLKHRINVVKVGSIELQKAIFEQPGPDLKPDKTAEELAREEEELLFFSTPQARSLKG